MNIIQWQIYRTAFFPSSRATSLQSESFGVKFTFDCSAGIATSLFHKWVLQQMCWVQDHLAHSASHIICKLPSAISLPYVHSPPYTVIPPLYLSTSCTTPFLQSSETAWNYKEQQQEKSGECRKGTCWLAASRLCFCVFKISIRSLLQYHH